MHILSYILPVLLVISCAPSTNKTNTPQTNPETRANPETRKSSDSTTGKTNKNTSQELKGLPAPEPAEEAAQNTPEPPSLIEEPVATASAIATTEPAITTSQLLSHLRGAYQFELDVYQNWNIFHMFRADTPITMKIAKNPRSNTEQLLIEVISDQEPIGKFCVIQSGFELQTEQNSNNEVPIETSIRSLSAQQYDVNRGGIVDINNVKNTIKINTYDPLSFTLEFYGDYGSEPVNLSASMKISENITQEFDSLCLSCGFRIGQDGLCHNENTSNFNEGAT